MAVNGAMRDSRPAPNPRRTFIALQYLRAFAAIIVVYEHTFSNHIAADRTFLKGFGLWGVDVFFVISGFIMGCSVSHPKPSWRSFTRNRFWRVVPMYWLATTVWIVSRFFIPDHLENRDISAQSVLSSYFFIPQHHLVFRSHIWPVLVPGWTLQLEMFFYGLLALVLSLSDGKFSYSAMIIALVALVGAGLVLAPTNAAVETYSSPLLLEFAAGLTMARYRSMVPTNAVAIGVPLGILSLVLAYYGIPLRSDPRIAVVVLGLPAVFLVAAALLCEDILAERPAQSLVTLGDASYSLYLFHPIITSIVAVLWIRAELHLGSWVFSSVAVCASAAGSVLLYGLVEQPLMRIGRRSLKPQGSVASAEAATL